MDLSGYLRNKGGQLNPLQVKIAAGQPALSQETLDEVVHASCGINDPLRIALPLFAELVPELV